MNTIFPTASSMEITQQVRDYAKQKGLHEEEAVAAGLTKKSEEFRDQGGEIYT